VSGARCAGDDALQRESGRTRLAASGRGPDEAGRAAAHRSGRAERDPAPCGCGSARSAHRRSALRQSRLGGDRPPRSTRCRGRPLPAIERVPRVRDRPTRRAARRRTSGRRRHGRRLVRAFARCVRRAARCGLGCTRPQRARRRALPVRGARAGDAGRRASSRARSRSRLTRPREARGSRRCRPLRLSVSTMGGSGSRCRLRRRA
jgi:hypothetical protein